ncbi:MAG: hypothetical protein PWQ79_2255 [Thermococcaceae archaeon]|nr:hypothetical protein [Thermococcaceae archaeon]MDK2915340.1 hypothetical protein [Thermococcaceae archaeon]
MPVLGFNITKIEVEKELAGIPQGQVEVRVTPRVDDVRLGEIMTPNGKVNGVEIVFSFEVTYSPTIGRGLVRGMVLYLPPQRERVDEIIDLWENEKKIDSMAFAEVVNFLMVELSPVLMVVAKEMRLPYHVALPRVEVRGENQ